MSNYPSLGRLAFSGSGLWTVRVFVVLEFLGSAVTCIVLLCKNIELLVKPLAGDITDENRFRYKLVLFGSVCVACTYSTQLPSNLRKKKAYSFKHNQVHPLSGC